MVSVRFQGKPFNITITISVSVSISLSISTSVIQVCAPTSHAEEAEVEQFYEDVQDLLEIKPPKDFLLIIGDWNAKVRSQEISGVTGKFDLEYKMKQVKRNAKECSNYHTIALILCTSKVMLRIIQSMPQQYVNHELPEVPASIRKGRGTRHQLANICWIIKKAREFQKNIYFCFIDYAKAFDCVDHKKKKQKKNCGKFFKRLEYQTTLLASLEICMEVKKQQLELDMEQ